MSFLGLFFGDAAKTSMYSYLPSAPWALVELCVHQSILPGFVLSLYIPRAVLSLQAPF